MELLDLPPGSGGLKMREIPFDKMLAVMETVSDGRRPLTVTEISGATDLAVPTVHRLVALLVDRGLLKRHLATKKVMPGARLMKLGVSAVQTSLYADKPHALLKSLVTRIGEFAQISLVVDGELICVDAASAHRESGLHLQQGNKAPLHCTSIGKLYLASLPEAELRSWLRSANLQRLTDRTVTDPSELRKRLKEIRARGWGSCNEEMHPGVVGCGVRLPLRDSSGFIGLCISAPAVRMNFEAITGHIPALRKVAVDIADIFDRTN
jgi:IclR family transcriptional regulator, acetate operon repressor